MVAVKDVLEMLRKMDGTQHVFELNGKAKGKLIEIEDSIRGTLGIKCANKGVEECLKREHVVVVIKDSRFRPPPDPTVLLVDYDGQILGMEIFPHQRKQFEGREDVLFLSQDFIVFADRKARRGECFLMPPVAFPELEEMPNTRNVISCSPSPLGDMFVRGVHDLVDDPKLASILIGWDDA